MISDRLHPDTQKEGWSDMTVNGSRRFRGNDKKSYFVQDAYKVDRHKGKYNLYLIENGMYKLCYDMFYNVLYFNTIKDAQREVLHGAEFIRTI